MSTKLRIRIGDVEIDYEGTEEFLKEEVRDLLNTAMDLSNAAVDRGTLGGGGGGGKGKSDLLSLSTGSIAAKTKASSGPDLLLAAAAHLTFFARQETFSRQELLTEMQIASAYYKKSYSNNLSQTRIRAVAEGTLSETAKDSYALTANARAELEGKLANS